jgi:hypothetical protein
LREKLVARMVAAGEKKPVIKRAAKIKSGQRRVFDEEIEQ